MRMHGLHTVHIPRTHVVSWAVVSNTSNRIIIYIKRTEHFSRRVTVVTITHKSVGTAARRGIANRIHPYAPHSRIHTCDTVAASVQQHAVVEVNSRIPSLTDGIG